MRQNNLPSLIDEFRTALADCQRLFFQCAQTVVQQQGTQLDRLPHEFTSFMEDLHKGVLVKLYVTITEADLRWSAEEREFAKTLFEHAWGKKLSDSQLKDAAHRIMHDAMGIKWPSLLKPFESYSVLREFRVDLLSIVMRIANLVAKCDRNVSPGEGAQLAILQSELEQTLGVVSQEPAAPMSPPLDEPIKLPLTLAEIRDREGWLSAVEASAPGAAPIPPAPPESLEEILTQLGALVGLDQVKDEVRTLANFLQMQRAREAAGLPPTPLSLHMVFVGNSGTGKTTVARIIGKVLGAMGVLKRGHLVETDRSGLVAEFAGQTGPKTNKRIDDALDGVLFIDEAYSLSYEDNDDAYGAEALQTLLKRMEDDRERLVVILAGYPEPMDRLLKSNPGLSSRFNTHFQFVDYRPSEMGRIFQSLCDKHHYVVPGDVQARLLGAFKYLYEHRDDHFGNGRLVRNVFETAIRKLANRIAGQAPLTKELLTTLAVADLSVPNLAAELLEEAMRPDRLYAFPCPGCEQTNRGGQNVLAKTVKCRACGAKFSANWGEPCE